MSKMNVALQALMSTAESHFTGFDEHSWTELFRFILNLDFNLKLKIIAMENYEIYPKNPRWRFIIQTLLAILSAIATSLGVSSCMSAL